MIRFRKLVKTINHLTPDQKPEALLALARKAAVVEAERGALLNTIFSGKAQYSGRQPKYDMEDKANPKPNRFQKRLESKKVTALVEHVGNSWHQLKFVGNELLKQNNKSRAAA